MERIVVKVNEAVSNCCGNRARVVIPVGIVFAYYLAKKGTAIYRYRQTCQKIKKKQQQLEESRTSFENRYPYVTERQKEIVGLDFPELKDQLFNGTLSALEVVEAFIAKAIEVNKTTNAVTEFLEDAITRAKLLDALSIADRGPLHGIPISLKEHINLKNKDCTLGIPSKIDILMKKDAELVLMLKKLGAVPFCRTNLPQTCISFDCSNPIFGVTRNFRNPERSPGGSSGGEGALIAGGGSIMGIGSDLGGSVRIPAAFSGITSLKPTSGRVPLAGQGNDGGHVGVVGLFNSLGFMARSARGIESCLRELLGEKVVEGVRLDPRFVPLPWSDRKMCRGRKLRIGWYNYDGCHEATPGFHRAVREAVDILGHHGHEIVKFCPPDLDKAFALSFEFVCADDGKSTKEMLADGPVDQQSLGFLHRILTTPKILRRLISKIIYLKSPILSGACVAGLESTETWKLYDLNAYRLQLIENILAAWDEKQLDVVICPGMAMPAQPLGYPGYMLGTISYTCVYNLLNFPAGSLTVSYESEADQKALDNYPGYEKDTLYGWMKDGTRGAQGMPLNVQVIGRPWMEEMVLRVMVELEDGVANRKD